MHGEDEGTLTWSEMERQLDESRTEVARLRKIFDDAGQGEHNVLALIEHYQDESARDATTVEYCMEQQAKAEHERDAYRAMLADLVAGRNRAAMGGPMPSDLWADLWARARELLKHGPKREETSDE